MTKTATAAATATETPDTIERFASLRLEQLYESPLNPRKTFDAGEDARLAASVREKGIIEPLVVRASTGDRFEVICGARRKRAAHTAGLAAVPAIIREYSDAQAIEIMAIENGQRASVPPLEEALGYKKLLLVDKTYTAAMIATKIGHDERYVWNRLRLLELIPEAQLLLKCGVIGVEHAEILAKLKEADQKRTIGRQNGGLFVTDAALEFDDRPRLGSSAYDRVKAVSVRELRQWVANNIRLDLAHAAVAAPLDFGESALRVAAAAQDDVRGKTPIPITFSHMCPAGAMDPKERTYGVTAWKKAEGKEGQPTCDSARLGVVVAGEHYGESFHVCINRDKCLVHWKDSVKAKAKASELRSKGQTKKAAKVEKNAEKKQESEYDRKNRQRQAREADWDPIEGPLLADAVEQVKCAETITPSQAKALEHEFQYGMTLSRDVIKEHLGASWFKKPAATLLVNAVAGWEYHSYSAKQSGYDTFVAEIAKPLGLDVKRLEAIRDKHAPKVEPKADSKTKAAKKS